MGRFTALIAMTEGRFSFLVITDDQPVNRPAYTQGPERLDLELAKEYKK